MANENDLLNRWTLAVENPKLVDSLNLQIQRDRLKKGYKPGSSPAEVELRARQADLEQRRRDYIEKANAQRAEDVKSNGVGRALPQEVDFSTHQPYVNIEGVDKWGHGGLKFDPGAPDDGTISAPTGKPVVDPAKNFAAFQDSVHRRMADENEAIAQGHTRLREKQELRARQGLKQFQPFTPIDAFGLGQDTLGESMTRNGQMIDVPRGRHFKDEDVFGAKIGTQAGPSLVGAPEATNFDPSENPVGDGDMPNDGVQGVPAFRGSGAGGSWDDLPTAMTPDEYKRGRIADSQINEPAAKAPSIIDRGKAWMSRNLPEETAAFKDFTDRRKPQTLIAPQTQPVAHRAY